MVLVWLGVALMLVFCYICGLAELCVGMKEDKLFDVILGVVALGLAAIFTIFFSFVCLFNVRLV